MLHERMETRPEAGEKAKVPTVRAANTLYLLTMVLVVTAGAWMQSRSFSWGLLGTEVLLLLVPTLLFIRVAGQPVAEALRLNWPGARLAGLSLLIGAGLWAFASWLELVMNLLFGYTTLNAPEAYPTSMGEAILVFLALAIAAPLCEEPLFRGYIQRAYERHNGWASILAVSLLFVFFHLRFRGLLPLIPVALGLSYVVWRSRSLIPGILVHFAINGLSAMLLIAVSMNPGAPQEGSALYASVSGLAGAAVAVFGLRLFRQAAEPQPQALPPARASWLASYWPLFAAAVIYSVVAGLEFVAGRYPEVLARGRLVELENVPREKAVNWTYELRDVLEEPVGEAVCELAPEAEEWVLACEVDQEAFEARAGGLFISETVEHNWRVHWSRDDMRLVQGAGELAGETVRLAWRLRREGEGLVLNVQQGDDPAQELALPPHALLSVAWPWHLSALPFDVWYAGEAVLAWLSRYQPDSGTSEPDIEAVLVLVTGAEPVGTPAGDFIAWRVELGDEGVAWYAEEPPHPLVRYEDGVVTYVLTGVHE